MPRRLVLVLLLAATLCTAASARAEWAPAEPRDHPGNRLITAGGAGEYDVMGQIIPPYYTSYPHFTVRGHVSHHGLGVQAEHEWNSGGYVLGVRGGVLAQSDDELLIDDVPSGDGKQSRSLGYWNPYVSMERYGWGLGIGMVMGSLEFPQEYETDVHRVSGHVRLGWRDGPYLDARYMEAVPVAVGASYDDAGIDVPLGRFGDVWAGKGWGGPSDIQTWALRGRLRISPVLSVLGGGGWGVTDGFDHRDVRISSWHGGLEWRSGD